MAICAIRWTPTLRGLTRALAWAMTFFTAHAAFAQQTLKVLTWPGYADPDLVKVFERQTGS